MNAFIYVVLGLMVACNIGICVWMVIVSRKSDEAYEKAIAEIYRRK